MNVHDDLACWTLDWTLERWKKWILNKKESKQVNKLYSGVEILILYVCGRATPKGLRALRLVWITTFVDNPMTNRSWLSRSVDYRMSVITPEWSMTLNGQFGMSLNKIVMWDKTQTRQWRLLLINQWWFRFRQRNYNDVSLCWFPQSKVDWNQFCDFYVRSKEKVQY